MSELCSRRDGTDSRAGDDFAIDDATAARLAAASPAPRAGQLLQVPSSGAKAKRPREDAPVAALLSSAEDRLAAFDAALAGPFYGPHLHRWGSAFPAGVLVPPDAAVVPSARVVFLGDYVDTGRAGTLEGAALSGLAAADALVDAAAAA